MTPDPTLAPSTHGRGTAYGVLQATNTYNQLEATVRGTTRPERTMIRAIDGTSGKADTEALAVLAGVMTAA